MIDVLETLNLARKNIWKNKVRSVLTMLGLIIGVASVILLVSVGQGLQNYITNQFEQLGSNLIYVLPGDVEGFGQGGGPSFQTSKLTLDHVEEIARLGGSIKNAAADNDLAAKVSYKGESKIVTVGGISSTWAEMMSIELDQGRMITKSDEDLARNVVILGQTVTDDLFGKTEPLGKEITIGDGKFVVIGIIGELGTQSIGFDIDNFVAIPITSSQKLFNYDSVQTIIIQAGSKDEIEDAKFAVERYMLGEIEDDDFSVVDQESLLETITGILSVVTAALGGIAAISLVVGGVGIMNIMLVTVTERTREIGLRKALGAKPNDILGQFLVEAVTLSVTGGLIGIGIGWGGSLIINQFFPSSVTLWAVALAFGVSAAVGIIFGVAPALRASKLNPIDALRYE